MAVTILVDKETMQTAITNYKTRKDNLTTTCLRISNEVRELGNTWNGEASEKFENQFQQLFSNMKQNETVMENVINKLEDALKVYEETEEEARSTVDAVDTGTAYQSRL